MARAERLGALLLARRRSAPAALVAGYALLIAAWALANPPFASPDEWSHYVRAVGIAAGDPIGDSVSTRPRPPRSVADARRQDWVRKGERAVTMPPGLWTTRLDCNGGKPDVSAACLDALPDPAPTDVVVATPVGNYQPLPYVLPGLAARRASDPETADRLGRLVAAAACLGFIAFAVFTIVSPDAGRLALLGPLAALTPMTLFVSSSLSPSGLEIASGLAFAAGLLRLSRGNVASSRVWAGTAIAGATLALSRSPGPLWVVLLLVVAVALAPSIFTAPAVRRRTVAAGAAVATATVLSFAWETAEGSRLPLRAEAVDPGIAGGIDRLPSVMIEVVGVFGSLDSLMPQAVSRAWQELVVALIVLAAVAAATRRERLVLAAGVGLALAVPVALSAVFRTGTGFDVQGRHVLPFVLVLPLLAAELLVRHRDRLPFDPASLVPWIAPFVAGVHLFAWYWNARRQAVGADGPLRFLGVAEWAPPLGWWPWLAVAAAGALLVALAPVLFRPAPAPGVTARSADAPP